MISHCGVKMVRRRIGKRDSKLQTLVETLEPTKLEAADAKVQPEESDSVKPTKENMGKDILIRFLRKGALVFLGYVICFMNWSLTLPVVTICTLVWLETRTSKKSQKITSKSRASSMTKQDMLQIVDQLPAWVMFPDRERAEWLNEIILQLWPSINSFIIKWCRGSLQTKIKKKFETFRFEDIDFGNTPPKIDGVKVYNKSVTKDSIVIDFDVFYDGDCEINFSVSGTQIGSIKDFQLGAELRVVLKPLMIKMPVIGGIQLFFLNTPDINFDLEGLSGVPGFSFFIRQKIESNIKKKLVFPNKITKRFSKTVQAAELKSLEPEGVLRVHVFEAKDLERKDVTGKSDPYVILNIGAQECRTPVIKRDLNPKWDYWCEFVILDAFAQHLHFKMFDQDDLNEDDFMGSGIIEIHTVIKGGENDKWFQLENAKHGKIHLRFTWLGLSAEYSTLNAAAQELKQLNVADISTALLTIYVDSAQNLMKVKPYRKPDPFVILTVGKKQQKTNVKKHTVDPVWEQGFSLLVANPANDSLIISIIDKQTDIKIDHFVYNIKNLFDQPGLQISKQEFELSASGKMVISLQLRILTNELFEDESSDSDSEEEFVRHRHNSNVSNASSRPASSSSSSSLRKIVLAKAEEVEEAVEKTVVEQINAPSVVKRVPSFKVKPDLGQLELTLSYREARQKLVVIVHRITNLPLKDPTDIPDPYVKLKLLSPGNHTVKYKTRVVADNCDPVFEETFEYLLSKEELSNCKLILTVKSKKMFFNSNAIGQVTINFKTFHDLQEPFREWFELTEAQDSD